MVEIIDCAICGAEQIGERCGESYSPGDDICFNCQQRYPPSLIKAAEDTYCYWLQTRDGTIWQFESCRLYGNWVHLDGVSDEPIVPPIQGTCPAPAKWFNQRGVDINMADIVWCADTPT